MLWKISHYNNWKAKLLFAYSDPIWRTMVVGANLAYLSPRPMAWPSSCPSSVLCVSSGERINGHISLPSSFIPISNIIVWLPWTQRYTQLQRTNLGQKHSCAQEKNEDSLEKSSESKVPAEKSRQRVLELWNTEGLRSKSHGLGQCPPAPHAHWVWETACLGKGLT